MGVSLYPVFEQDVPGYDACAVVGKALCHAVYNWDIPEVAALAGFFSVSPEEVAALAGYSLPGGEENEDTDLPPAPPDFQPPPEAWYESEAGLIAIREAKRVLQAATIAAAERLDTPENRVEWVISDLEAVEQVLTLAQEHSTHFHLAMDY